MMPTEEFWRMAGIALLVFAICVGMGSCGLMLSIGQSMNEKPIVSFEFKKDEPR